LLTLFCSKITTFCYDAVDKEPTRNNFVFNESDPYLLYSYIWLGAIHRRFQKDDAKKTRQFSSRLFFPDCYLLGYSSVDDYVMRINQERLLVVAIFTTRCNQPRTDILFVDMNEEERKQLAENNPDAPFKIKIIKLENNNWLKYK
jgi:hypothetical protein